LLEAGQELNGWPFRGHSQKCRTDLLAAV
jgi:hypothetical protein